MINEENVTKWIEALRSGDYKQGKNALASAQEHDTDGEYHYCCLGVACELAVADGVVIDVVEEDNEKKYDGRGDLLPTSVQQWFGLEAGVFGVSRGGNLARTDLAAKNDNGASFEDIAGAIEDEQKARRQVLGIA